MGYWRRRVGLFFCKRTQKMSPKLLIVDDHQMFAEGIRFLIEHTPDFEVVGIQNCGQAVMPFLIRTPVDILLLDIQLPDITGFVLVSTIRQAFPHIKILALSMLADWPTVSRILEVGATGYCPKSAGWDELYVAIQCIGAGNSYLPVEYMKQYHQRTILSEHNALTERETEIVQLIAEGINTKQIADRLFLSTRTVETHRKNIYRKACVHTNVELTLYARTHHLI